MTISSEMTRLAAQTPLLEQTIGLENDESIEIDGFEQVFDASKPQVLSALPTAPFSQSTETPTPDSVSAETSIQVPLPQDESAAPLVVQTVRLVAADLDSGAKGDEKSKYFNPSETTFTAMTQTVGRRILPMDAATGVSENNKPAASAEPAETDIKFSHTEGEKALADLPKNQKVADNTKESEVPFKKGDQPNAGAAPLVAQADLRVSQRPLGKAEPAMKTVLVESFEQAKPQTQANLVALPVPADAPKVAQKNSESPKVNRVEGPSVHPTHAVHPAAKPEMAALQHIFLEQQGKPISQHAKDAVQEDRIPKDVLAARAETIKPSLPQVSGARLDAVQVQPAFAEVLGPFAKALAQELLFEPRVGEVVPVQASDPARQIGIQHVAPPVTPQARFVVHQMAVAVSQNTPGTTELFLSPEELGRVRMVVTTQDMGILVSVMAERPETMDLLRRNIDHLAQEFRNLGYSSAEFQFDGQQSGEGPNGTDRFDDDDPVVVIGPAHDAAASSRQVQNASGLDLRV